MYHRKAFGYGNLTGSMLINLYNEHFAQCFLGLHQTDSAFYAKKFGDTIKNIKQRKDLIFTRWGVLIFKRQFG